MSTQLDIIRRQVESSARNQVSSARAQWKRETSLVGKASQFGMELGRQGEEAVRKHFRRESQRTAAPCFREDKEICVLPAEDGYLRRSPVQPVKVSATYYRGILRRTAGVAGAVVLVVAVMWLLTRFGLLAF